MNIAVVATHDFGLFKNLINNEYDIPIDVLAYGKKWTGFGMKSFEFLKHADTLEDDDILICLDAFDTIINKNPKNTVELFKKMNTKILLSNHPSDPQEFLAKRIFGNCKNNQMANSGMIMGYVKELKDLFQQMSQMECDDDQRNLNTICKNLDYVKIDTENIIFENIVKVTNPYKTSDAIFVSYPGSFSLNRWGRAIMEYTQFFIPEVLGLLILHTVLCIYFKQYIPMCILIFIILIVFIFMKKKCIQCTYC